MEWEIFNFWDEKRSSRIQWMRKVNFENWFRKRNERFAAHEGIESNEVTKVHRSFDAQFRVPPTPQIINTEEIRLS